MCSQFSYTPQGSANTLLTSIRQFIAFLERFARSIAARSVVLRICRYTYTIAVHGEERMHADTVEAYAVCRSHTLMTLGGLYNRTHRT